MIGARRLAIDLDFDDRIVDGRSRVRLRARLRRVQPDGDEPVEVLAFSDFSLDLASRVVRRGDLLMELTRSEFEDWARDNTVRLVVDQSVKGKNIDDTTAKVLHSRNLKKKYKASGYPSLHVLAPSGEVIGRYKSYRPGQEDFLWGQLKQGVSLAKERHQSWKASLEKKGYRDWSNEKGKVIFAKLGAYKDGQMILVEPDGQRVRTHEKNLSAGDRVWIQQEKEKRGIRYGQ